MTFRDYQSAREFIETTVLVDQKLAQAIHWLQMALDQVERLMKLNDGLGERVKKQSELLADKAEKS